MPYRFLYVQGHLLLVPLPLVSTATIIPNNGAVVYHPALPYVRTLFPSPDLRVTQS